MSKTVLITGGAGFIGSHLADELLAGGHRVRVLDRLWHQVHGPDAQRPEYLDPEVELQIGDVRNVEQLRAALAGVDVVFHFAAAVGVGQSMYQIAEYVDTNVNGTAVLLQELIERPVERLLVASSMSVYGEGLYRDGRGRTCLGVRRSRVQLQQGLWELLDGEGAVLEPLPTPESKVPELASVYALNKYDQERMCLLVGQAYGMKATALRFFNTYGPRQALSNPYTGVVAVFASRLLNNRPPLLFEDGRQRRDLVSVHDVARACRLAMEADGVDGEVLNIASGEPLTVQDLARRAANALGKGAIEPEITGQYRVGDIRHCFADISLARQRLGYRPQVSLEAGLQELAGWLEGRVVEDRAPQMRQELMARGLAI